jgi:hypothetical protein
MGIQGYTEHIDRDEEQIWGFGRVIRFMSEKLGGMGLWGPRFPF